RALVTGIEVMTKAYVKTHVLSRREAPLRLSVNGYRLSVEARSLELGARSSDYCPLPSALCPLTSALCPLTSDLRPPAFAKAPAWQADRHVLGYGDVAGGGVALL